MTSSKNPPLDLPKIPSLPPIQMPDSFNQFPNQKKPTSPSSHNSSSSPYASQDTFLTAHTSLSPDQPTSSSGNGSPVYLYPPAASAMHSPAGLRKSISVDSFVSTKHVGLMSARPNPPSPLSSEFRASQGDADRLSPPYSRQSDAAPANLRPTLTDRDKRAPVTSHSASSRSRGTSVSTTTDDRDPGSLDESDMERSEDFSRRTRKGKQTSRQSVRPGELPMPSRLPPKASVPSMHIGQASTPISPSRTTVVTKHKSLSQVQSPHYQRLPDDDEVVSRGWFSPSGLPLTPSASGPPYRDYASRCRPPWLWQVCYHSQGTEAIQPFTGRGDDLEHTQWPGAVHL